MIDKQKRAAYIAQYRQNIKDKLVQLAGGACEICNYCKSNRALDFHHIDPQTKLFGIARAGASKSLVTILEELKKCILLCANCHREVEGGEIDILLLDRTKFVDIIEQEIAAIMTQNIKIPQANYCPVCGELAKRKFCSKLCSEKAQAVRRPSKDVFEIVFRDISNYRELAEIFGVSYNTIRKWVKLYHLNGGHNITEV